MGTTVTDWIIAEAIDPSLLRKHSAFKSYRTATATYPRVRTFYHPHPHADKLPNSPPLPLLVFIHGLGGSLSQFGSLLTALVNSAPCFGIDLPGCGTSEFAPKSWDAYSHRALVELLAVAIQEACDVAGTNSVTLVGHSLGCSLAVSLAAPGAWVACTHTFKVLGLVAICPMASALTPEKSRIYRRLLHIPTPVFDLWRRWDRIGGVKSPSVLRFVGVGADAETKRLQLRYNEQSRTPVWRRMAWGCFAETGSPSGQGLPTVEVWATLRIPILVVAGEDDPATPPSEVTLISKALSAQGFERYHQAANQSKPHLSGENGEDHAATPNAGQQQLILKTYILPSPASHSLLFDRGTYRTLSGLVQTFIADHVDPRLSLGWQLRTLRSSNKWDVKNLAKWKAVLPVSDPIAGIFRAMKTLREVDDVHAPLLFVQKWRGQIKAVVDISHESPVYNPRELDAGGIEYHKFPTVSKLPPTPSEVEDFTALVDQLRRGAGELGAERDDGRLIAVHCHYGFNRTGFFICAYLIQREGYGVQQALDEFQARRYPGIRHEHFVDTLFVRYCVGLKRPTVARE